RPVDCLRERDLAQALERRPVVIESEVVRRERWVDEEAPGLSVDPVFGSDVRVILGGNPETSTVVQLVLLDRDPAALPPSDRPDDLVDVRGPRAPIEGVSLEHELAAWDTRGDGVRA